VHMQLRIDKSRQSRAGNPQLVLALLVLSQASFAADLAALYAHLPLKFARFSARSFNISD